MEVKIFMAQAANAKIARENGDEDFLSSKNWQEFKKIAEKIGAFAVGRKTYEAVRNWEEKSFKDISATRIVLSRKEDFQALEGYLSVSSLEEAVKAAENQGLETLLVTGGASVNTSFIQKGLVDEIVLNIEPYILGKGLNLFTEEDFEADLELLDTCTFEEGIVQLHYRVSGL